ncbi:MAG TPA: ABC transporter permease [Gemmatimonadaceae bacterium]
MSVLTRLLHGTRSLFRRDAEHRELDDEVRHFLDQAIAEHVTRGMSPDEAARVARASLGSVAAVQEPARAHGWDVVLTNLAQDLQYAMRYLAKAPGFTLTATLSLALGIGANTAIFSMVNATLLRRLPVERSQELVAVASPSGSGVYSYPAFEDLRRGSTPVLSDMLGYGGIGVSLNEGNDTDLIQGMIVTGNYFQLLGVRPLRGRLLQPSDDVTPGAHPVAVISASLWRTRFGERGDIVGLPVRLNGQPYTIIGVAPAGFHGTQLGQASDLFVPMMMQGWMRPPRSGYSGEMDPDLLRVRSSAWISAVGRLNPGVSIAQAEGALTGTARAMGDWTSAADSLPRVTLTRLDDGPPGQREDIASAATLMSAIVGVVLIIACANVANLLLARAGTRRREIAVRLSLGATRGRLVRQLLTESILLATMGGLVGLALAWIAVRAMRAAPPPAGALPVFMEFAIDWRVMAFTMALSVVTGVVFGLVPALRASRPDLVPALKNQSAADDSRSRWLTARNGLVVAQVGLSLVLLIASGLFVRSLSRTRALDPGFDHERLLTVPLNIQLLRYTSEQGRSFYRDVIERVEAVPGVQSASISRWIPLVGGGSIGRLEVEGQEPGNPPSGGTGGYSSANPTVVLSNNVGTRYLETVGIRIVRGRNFDARDHASSPRVAIVSEEFVRRHFPGVDPIGRRIGLGVPLSERPLEVIGVAEDARYLRIDESLTRIAYIPATQHHVNGMTLLVRARGNPALLKNDIARAVHSLDRSLPVANARTYDDWIGIAIYAARAGAVLVTGFGALALLLAAVGLYGVLSYTVSRRSREFGVRMALGAKGKQVLRQVLFEGLGLAAVGVVAGIVVALSVTRLLARFLYGVSATDAVTFAWTPIALFAVAALACLMPALRATRVDPVRALRQE